MPNPYNGTQSLFNISQEFARPLDLSQGGSCQVPPLQEPALLELGDEQVLIVPEMKCEVPTLQDCRIVALNALIGLGRTGSSRKLMTDVNKFDIAGSLPGEEDSDSLPEWGGLSLATMIIRNGEEVKIGRDTTPRLRLGDSVSSAHAIVEVNDAGLRIEDVSLRNRFLLRLANSDAFLPRPPLVQERVGAKTRNDLLSAYAGLCVDGGFQVANDDLDIKGMQSSEDGVDRLELFVKKAAQYPSVAPASDFHDLKISIDSSKEGAETYYFAKNISREPGVTLSDVEGQLTTRQAHDLLRIGLEISLSR